MAHSKPLLIPWLRDKIDSGKYQGVSWTNAEKTEFSIPWKHGLRGDSTDTDVLIFKAWAEVSGNGRAQGEPSVWKRNFRSALRAKGFKLVFDNKKDDANPHKIFHWPEESSSGASSAAGSQELTDNVFDTYIIQDNQVVPFIDGVLYLPEEDLMSGLEASPDILQECLKGLNIDPEAGITGFEPPPEQQQLQNHGLIGGHPLPGQQQDPVMFVGAASETGLPEQPACPPNRAEGGADGDEATVNFMDIMHKTGDGNSLRTQFRILMYYRGVKVSEKLVENEAGFRLVYRPDLFDSALDSQTGLSMVSLPIPGDMLDKTQAKLTQRILDTLGEGLEVGVSGNLVYGRRRGDTKVFWSFSKFDSSRIPQEVSKLNPDALFLWKNFIQGIIDFSYGGDCPPCSLFFCLGEKWPDPENRPWMKKLITIEVVLTSPEIIKNIAVEGGASSLRSVELQESLGEMMELC
ncbi:interferon regulatory factor 3 [Oryzias melastigma]|uniref:interferon regulatory factor 3 n=1 Tax=Oryzias melastigma TaxID=30732 RepID=UPI000CF81D31|nr:interferon regulatory factor 3 [Oryzias melastigma]